MMPTSIMSSSVRQKGLPLECPPDGLLTKEAALIERGLFLFANSS